MADVTVTTYTAPSLNERQITAGPVYISPLVGYIFFLDGSNVPVYVKTSNGGASWSGRTVIGLGTSFKMCIWYDRWTPGNTGTKIHIIYQDYSFSNIFYRDLDTDGDSLGTERTVFAGSTFETLNFSDAMVSIVKARGGNLYVGFWGDNDGEFGFYRSENDGDTWTSRVQLADGNAVDQIILMPGDEVDSQDIWCIYWDVSADEISLKVHDDSGNSWSETLIATGMVDTAAYFQMSASPRHSDNHVMLVAWSELDVATADLKVWDIGGSGSITTKADVVTDLAESAGVAVFIDQQTNDIYVAYMKGGTWQDTVDVKYRKSTDGGATWGAEQDYFEAAADDIRALWAGISVGRDGGRFQPVFFNDDLDDLFVNLVNDVHIMPSVNTFRAAYVGATVDAVPDQLGASVAGVPSEGSAVV